MRPHEMVYLKWTDALEAQAGWKSKEDLEEWIENQNWIIHQVGWIIEETDDYIIIVSRFTEEENEDDIQYNGIFKLPKPWILERKTLTV